MKAKAPMTVSDRMMTVAKTGRRTEMDASHCMCIYLRRSVLMTDGCQRAAATVWPSASRPFGSVGDRFAFRDARRDLDAVADRLAEGDDALLDVVVLDDVDAAGAGDGFDGVEPARAAPASPLGWWMRAVANIPGLSRPSGFVATASTVSAR